jgi:hypothetical protein
VGIGIIRQHQRVPLRRVLEEVEDALLFHQPDTKAKSDSWNWTQYSSARTGS